MGGWAMGRWGDKARVIKMWLTNIEERKIQSSSSACKFTISKFPAKPIFEKLESFHCHTAGTVVPSLFSYRGERVRDAYARWEGIAGGTTLTGNGLRGYRAVRPAAMERWGGKER